MARYDETNDVQFPHYTRVNPDLAKARAAPDALSSRQFIAKFEAKDTDPVEVVDDASQAERDAQVVRLTRRLLPTATTGATDTQVLQLYRDYMAGRY